MDDIVTTVDNSGYYEDWHQFRLLLEKYEDRFGNPMPLELRLEFSAKIFKKMANPRTNK